MDFDIDKSMKKEREPCNICVCSLSGFFDHANHHLSFHDSSNGDLKTTNPLVKTLFSYVKIPKIMITVSEASNWCCMAAQIRASDISLQSGLYMT